MLRFVGVFVETVFGVQGVLKCIVGEFIGVFVCSLRKGAASRGANKVSVQCVGVLDGGDPYFEGLLSSVITFRLSLSFEVVVVYLDLLCACCAFCVRFVYVGFVSGVGSIVESDVILG